MCGGCCRCEVTAVGVRAPGGVRFPQHPHRQRTAGWLAPYANCQREVWGILEFWEAAGNAPIARFPVSARKQKVGQLWSSREHQEEEGGEARGCECP